MQPILVATFSLAGVLVGAALQYASGRSLEARKQLTSRKAEAYIDLFRAIALVAKGGGSDQLASAADAKSRICLYGSLAVVDRLAAFERAGASLTNDEGRRALLDLLRAMRADLTSGRDAPRDPDLAAILYGIDGAGDAHESATRGSPPSRRSGGG